MKAIRNMLLPTLVLFKHKAVGVATTFVAVIGISGFASASDDRHNILGSWEAVSEVHIEGEGIPFVVEETHDGVKLVVTDTEEDVFRGYFEFQMIVGDKVDDEVLHFVGLFRKDNEFVIGTKLGTVIYGDVAGDVMSIDYLSFGSSHAAGSYELRRAEQ